MTAFKHLRRRPHAPNPRFGVAGCPSRFVTDGSPFFAGGPFRQAIRSCMSLDGKPTKPHLR
ncbi:hypothetical protein [Bradyrhizobium sp. S3.5.5]|uniref:hypothetical protein n=1 Tax=Bradyrhizobium sp. S3.5.5 TaxID=3156430 RepID=UPI0033967E9A